MKSIQISSSSEPDNVLDRIKRGLAGYVSYLAACEMNESFSEYILYEPILRILTGRGYVVNCEVPCPGIKQPPKGDKKKLDFVAKNEDATFAMEVKWATNSSPDVENDLVKLVAFSQHELTSRSFLCLFGRRSHIESISFLTDVLKEFGPPRYANFGKTRFGCRIYEVVANRAA